MIPRQIESSLRELAGSFRAVAVVGPRQSGKTTLVRHVFPDKPYVSLENPSSRRFANEDPIGFLAGFPGGAILDEAQHVPELFSYLQQILDESDTPGRYIITGSNNFLLLEKISQTLAGRVGYLDLLPFSISESALVHDPPVTIEQHLFRGGYPGVLAKRADPVTWYESYIRSYVERDVRQMKNLGNLTLFEKLLHLCAGRTGQQLNLTSLGIEAGIDHKTVMSWLSVLQAGYVVFLLQPFYRNFSKRIIKAPKLYFYDTGLACSLLRIQSADDILHHSMRAALVENFLVAELMKNRANMGKRNNLYYWRDSTGHEVDVLIDLGSKLLPIEIKSGETITSDYFKGLRFFSKVSGTTGGNILYLGRVSRYQSDGIRVIPWNEVSGM